MALRSGCCFWWWISYRIGYCVAARVLAFPCEHHRERRVNQYCPRAVVDGTLGARRVGGDDLRTRWLKAAGHPYLGRVAAPNRFARMPSNARSWGGVTCVIPAQRRCAPNGSTAAMQRLRPTRECTAPERQSVAPLSPVDYNQSLSTRCDAH